MPDADILSSLFPEARTNAGASISGAKLWTYQEGTTTPLASYQNAALTTAHANPIVFGADGRPPAPIYLKSEGYKFRLLDADDTLIEEVDNYLPPSARTSIQAVDTLAALKLETGASDGDVRYMLGRTAQGDGGGGFWRWSATSTATANDGTIVQATGVTTGRWLRIIDGPYKLEWFGDSSDWGAAFTAAAAAMPSAGGRIKLREGGDYTFTTEAYSKVSNFTLDAHGATIRPRNASGPTFKFGDGTSQIIENTVCGGYWDPGSSTEGGTNTAVFDLRGVRTFRTDSIRGVNIYQIARWGVPADTIDAYQWYQTSCDWGMRSNANGGHTDAIQADGSLGGYYESDTFIEGDAANVTAAVAVFRLTSAQGPARFDHLSRSAGNWKGFDYGLRCEDARIVNYDESAETRTDDMQVYSHYVVATSGATKGGVEDANFRGTYGGIQGGGGIYIEDQKGGLAFQNISLSEMRSTNHRDTVATFRTSGSGAITNVTINGLRIGDFEPGDATTDAIVLDGDIDEVLVDDISLTGKSGATYQARYAIYNNTASTKRVRIGTNVVAGADVNTNVVYDPNIGDLSIGRYCGLRPDGTKRATHTLGPFSADNIPASTSNGFLGTSFGGVATAYSAGAFGRGRIIGINAQLTGTVTAGTLTLGGAPGGAIDANLDLSFTSADGANPQKVVRYAAGSSAIAENGKVEARYTSDASLAPTTMEAAVWIVFEEM